MQKKVVMEGNAFYEIDDECIRKKELQEKKEQTLQKRQISLENGKK